MELTQSIYEKHKNELKFKSFCEKCKTKTSDIYTLKEANNIVSNLVQNNEIPTFDKYLKQLHKITNNQKIHLCICQKCYNKLPIGDNIICSP